MRIVSAPGAATPEQLLRRFRETRDPAALGALYDATAPDLLRVALAIAPDAPSAENALQETFLALLEHPESWDSARPVMPWLLGILHRQVGKVRRDAARVPDPLRVAPPLAVDDPAATAASRDEQLRVRAAIDELPEPYRAVALMRWQHGLDPADIANLRREPPGTTRSLLSRALEKLRDRLGGGALAIFGVPGTKGIGGIRRVLMSKAAAATATATATGTTIGVGGAIVMKKLVAAALAVVLLAGGTWWTVSRLSEAKDEAKVVAESAPAPPPVAPPPERKRTHVPDVVAAPPADELPPPVDLDRCDRDLDLFGKVTDEDGKDVAGASVATIAHPWRRFPAPGRDTGAVSETGPKTRTARDGSFALRLPRGALVDLRVAAEGFGEIVRRDCQAGERVAITLRRGSTLEVSTVDGADVPLGGVPLTIDTVGPDRSYSQHFERVTDASGRASVTGVAAGTLFVLADPPDLGAEWQSVNVPDRGTTTVRLVLTPGRTVRGRVTDATRGEPIAGARVGSRLNARSVATDDDGGFEFRGWTGKSERELVASASGYVAAIRPVPDSGDLDFALAAGDAVVGRVVRADGVAVAGALIAVNGRGSSSRERDDLAGQAGADGRFEITGLRHESGHTLTVCAPGAGKTLLAFGPASEPRGRIDLGDVVLPAARCIEGVAEDGEGRPVANASVSLNGPTVERAGGPQDPRPTTVSTYEFRRTDDLGRFRFPDLAPGTFTLSVSVPDAPQSSPVRVVLPADRDVLDARVRLMGSRSITLLVVDDDGSPIAGAGVQVNALSGVAGIVGLNGRSGADGRATFRGLPVAGTTFFVSAPALPVLDTTTGPIVPEGREVRVVLHRAALIRGFLRTGDGTPAPDLHVKAKLASDGSDAGYGWGDKTGAFSIKVPVGRSVDLFVDGTQTEETAAGTRSRATGFRGSLRGVSGPAEGVEIVLVHEEIVRDRTLVVVVQDSSGAPVSGFEVDVHESPKSVRARTDEQGRARLEGLPNFRVHVWLSDGLALERPRPLDIPPAGFDVVPAGQEILVKYRAGTAIRGRVVDASGSPVPRPFVRVSAEGRSYSLRCGADGRFVTGGLPDLPMQLEADGYVGKTECVGVAAGVVPGDAEVTITVAPKAK